MRSNARLASSGPLCDGVVEAAESRCDPWSLAVLRGDGRNTYCARGGGPEGVRPSIALVHDPPYQFDPTAIPNWPFGNSRKAVPISLVEKISLAGAPKPLPYTSSKNPRVPQARGCPTSHFFVLASYIIGVTEP